MAEVKTAAKPAHRSNGRALARDAALFPTLGADDLDCLAQYGEKIDLTDGETVFREGEPETDFYVVLEGGIRVTKKVAGEQMLLANHLPGQFSGALTMLLDGGKSIATGRAVGQTRVVRIDGESFFQLFRECPDVARTIISTMARRRPEVEAIGRQREKLAALGKLAAGLAHELNNPASAIGRAASQLQGAIDEQRSLALEICRHGPTNAQIDRLAGLVREAEEHSIAAPAADPIQLSDREQELDDWLDAKGVPESWNVAGALAGAGIDREWLQNATDDLSEGCVSAAVNWLTASLSTQSLLGEVVESAKRISELVQAIKDYSYMDQAPLQEIDVHSGLESTLTILGHKFRKRGIEIVREYDCSLPRIPAYGSELNQVWTNLIVNAIDALNGPGHITIRTSLDEDCVLVEIMDDGPGIPKELQARVFDPFFTTKDVGEGTGLGLDISYRIVTERHHGDIRVESRPGETRFQVWLPLAQAPAPKQALAHR